LCSDSADTMNQGTFAHFDEDWCVFGTCVFDEVRKAVEMGYGEVDMFELWGCKVTCIDKNSNGVGLFAEYVNMFLTLKQEFSDSQSWVQS